MNTVSLEEAQARLPDLIDRLAAGEELVMTRNQWPVARLLAEDKSRWKARKAGNCKGMLAIVANDDQHLRDFA